MQMKRRHYNNGEAEFIMEPVNDAVVKVIHRDQTGWFGISRDWDPQQPYTETTVSSFIRDDGIGGIGFLYASPDDALRALCTSLLNMQRKQDSRRVNPEARKAAAVRVLCEFMNEQPG